jgi:hypothetical protein
MFDLKAFDGRSGRLTAELWLNFPRGEVFLTAFASDERLLLGDASKEDGSGVGIALRNVWICCGSSMLNHLEHDIASILSFVLL